MQVGSATNNSQTLCHHAGTSTPTTPPEKWSLRLHMRLRRMEKAKQVNTNLYDGFLGRCIFCELGRWGVQWCVWCANRWGHHISGHKCRACGCRWQQGWRSSMLHLSGSKLRLDEMLPVSPSVYKLAKTRLSATFLKAKSAGYRLHGQKAGCNHGIF